MNTALLEKNNAVKKFPHLRNALILFIIEAQINRSISMSEGLQVVMSPVQMAAVLSDNTLTEAETLQNRLLG